ncbi:hypothetical protein BN2475_190071 [Paraburkholderia ribeironis]|uniref:Uncharacterized protein n=1 Tax=Paraburkholderia ribeironis TaxID=1247936 RepID=A0A1N7RWG5_9BURK|nr:hypothetical protein BN2475_190071 [Paraburkholderia ribeironis]
MVRCTGAQNLRPCCALDRFRLARVMSAPAGGISQGSLAWSVRSGFATGCKAVSRLAAYAGPLLRAMQARTACAECDESNSQARRSHGPAARRGAEPRGARRRTARRAARGLPLIASPPCESA